MLGLLRACPGDAAGLLLRRDTYTRVFRIGRNGNTMNALLHYVKTPTVIQQASIYHVSYGSLEREVLHSSRGSFSLQGKKKLMLHSVFAITWCLDVGSTRSEC